MNEIAHEKLINPSGFLAFTVLFMKKRRFLQRVKFCVDTGILDPSLGFALLKTVLECWLNCIVSDEVGILIADLQRTH